MPNPMSLYAVVGKLQDISDQALKAFGWSRGKLEDMLSETKSDSLTKQVSGSVSVVPIIITSDIPEQAASIIAQMSEIEFANYMTIALANSPKVNIHDINDGKYLKKYHTNLSKVESVLADSFDEDSEIESGLARSICESVAGRNVSIIPSVQNQLKRNMIEAMDTPNKFYGLEWLMEAKKPNRPKEGSEEDYRLKRLGDYNTGDDPTDPNSGGPLNHDEKGNASFHKDMQDSYNRERKEKRDNISTAFNISKGISSEARAWNQYNYQKEMDKKREKREEEQTIDSHVSRDFSKTYTIKKLNEMQPTPVVARIFTVDDNNTPSRQIEIVSGVKAKLHQINKKEFISLMKSEDPGNILTTIIRFTSGEIHFFRDVLFGSSSIKEYAAKSGRFSSAGAKVLATLKRIKDMNRQGKNYKPNAILVVSKAAVDELKRVHGIDLLDEEDALQICDRLSLIKLIISDPIGGKLHILMPGMHDTFSVVSTDTLEKQIDATQDAALTKELRKIVSKGA